MQDLFISINKNVARISSLDKEGIKSNSQLLTESAVKDTKILDTFAFAQLLEGLINQITVTPKSKLRLNFIVSPEDTISKFITINKTGGVADEQILAELDGKLDGETLDNLYFSYQKIAPFVYQFVGVKKDLLEKYIEVANHLKLSLYTVIPWALLLPKYVGTNDSAIFISSIDSNQVVALSELGGIFFTGVFKKQKSPDELNDIIQELSVYKRQKPIQKIYTLNYPLLTLSEGYTIHQIDLPNADAVDSNAFEANLLTNYMLDLDPSIATTQMNLLNLLPLPAVENNSHVLAKLKIPALVIATILILVGGFTFFTKHAAPAVQNNNVAVNTNVQVLGESTAPQSTETVKESSPSLKQADLKIRVENGSNITGIAAKTKDFLVAKGYVVTDIATANDTKTATLFRFKKGKIDYKTLLSTDTKTLFPQITIEDTLAADSAYDVLVVVGTTVKF